ncbi:MAG TPA: multicopper oxidase domain-containing protein [Candidatus Limnocylindrales bacterium]|nr:multicopper oxidase domain-containing protein [Candidatus Limnocylindrales bacterium]
MKSSQRLAAGASVVVAALAGVVVLQSAGMSRPARDAATAAQFGAHPCTPHVLSRDLARQQPPVIAAGGTTTLYVLHDGDNYCYRVAPASGTPGPYVDAPTFRVRQGQSLNLVLVDTFGESPGPMPMPTSPDGCALLPFEPSPLPPNRPNSYLGHDRIYQTMPSMEPDTNLHMHGWHGSPEIDNVFKSLAMTRGNTCSFTFAMRSGASPSGAQPAGTYWYHAHLHGQAFAQVGGGLAGVFIVDPSPVPAATPIPEQVLLIKDLREAAPQALPRAFAAPNAGTLRPRKTLGAAAPHAPRADPFSPPPWPSGWPINAGAQYCPSAGNSNGLMVNGYPIPDGVNVKTAPALSILEPGQKRLFRIADAASDDYVNVQVLDGAGKPEPLVIVGRDGHPVGDGSNPEGGAVTDRTNVLLPPGGRVDIVVTGAQSAQRIVSGQVCTGYAGLYEPHRTIAQIMPLVVRRAPRAMLSSTAGPKPLTVTAAERFLRDVPATYRRSVAFTQYASPAPQPSGPPKLSQLAWYVTQIGEGPAVAPSAAPVLPFHEQPFWLQPAAAGDQGRYLPHIHVKRRTVEEWYLVNASPEIHAFHIHQLTFVTEQSDFEGGKVHIYQDTVALPPAKIIGTPPYGPNPLLAPSVTKIKIDFRNVDKGQFVFHCHMLFHEDAGMMGIVEVD